MKLRQPTLCLALSLPLFSAAHFVGLPGAPEQLGVTVTYGRSTSLIEQAASASEGYVGAEDLAKRPFLRRGELLEVVPGLVVTQHSGSGKANQYFLRGFNLDHGTDFAVTVDGMPVNMVSHAHGQAYADMNFVIPETIQGINYQKGSYFADQGDFSAAGSSQIELVRAFHQGTVKAEVGKDDYYRAFAGDTIAGMEPNTFTTVAAEASYYNGPWTTPEASRRFNAFARHSWGNAEENHAVTVMAYDAGWRSTDQVPKRALDAGILGRFDTMDPTDGGEASRVSVSYDGELNQADGQTKFNAYLVASELDLYSNFTYFTDPVSGDQFNQTEDRIIAGGSAGRVWAGEVFGKETLTTVGTQVRADFVDVGLHQSDDRRRLATIREDEVSQGSVGVFAKSGTRVNDWLRMVTGVRGDVYAFDVDSDNPLNSGDRTAAIASPKINVIFGPWAKTEFYLSGGLGFHSNDARGTTITVDPATGLPADQVDPLVRTKGAEVGIRTAALPGLVSTVSYWMLDLDSEIVFVGDGGGTEVKGASRRQGVEWANFYQVNEWLSLEADFAMTQARYRRPDPGNGGREVAGALESVATGGVVVDLPQNWSASLRARYFGPQWLSEDKAARAPSSLTFNARLGWHSEKWQVNFDVLNVFDRNNNDISYYYESQLIGEAAPVADVHLHPAEPRTFRVMVSRHF